MTNLDEVFDPLTLEGLDIPISVGQGVDTWAYKVIVIGFASPEHVAMELSMLGAAGWELVHIRSDSFGVGREDWHYFKRRRM